MNRRTTEWTENVEDAFVNRDLAIKGRMGEKFLMKTFDDWGWEFKDHHSDKNLQISGIDISFKKPEWYKFYTCDVKNNMTEYGTFYVYENWLEKSKADRIFHVNHITRWIAWYGVEQMLEYFNKNKTDKEWIAISTKTIKNDSNLNFISRSRSNVRIVS